MIRITSTDEQTARRVVATVTVDGREYARLCASADKFNEWARRGLFGWTDTDNTPATIMENFYLCTSALDDDESRNAADTSMDGLDMGEELPDTLAEMDRRRPYWGEMREAFAEADRRWKARAICD